MGKAPFLYYAEYNDSIIAVQAAGRSDFFGDARAASPRLWAVPLDKRHECVSGEMIPGAPGRLHSACFGQRAGAEAASRSPWPRRPFPPCEPGPRVRGLAHFSQSRVTSASVLRNASRPERAGSPAAGSLKRSSGGARFASKSCSRRKDRMYGSLSCQSARN